MEKRTIPFVLKQSQQITFFALILTYLFSATAHPLEPLPRETIERLQEVADSVRPWRKDARENLEMRLSPETVEAIKGMITALHALYEQWEPKQEAMLQGLTMCQTLIEEAELRARSRSGGSENGRDDHEQHGKK